ncbi:formate-dependent nitrite reductase complex subunit NrfG [Ferrimonas sediminum]|uniref:Formate-dependent nitrite reductase complex subunit NrfG n=1 Tax=Ferrimonas sediminum TaxID=718193 RepID=A0A1G8Z8L1_9GAMM|nr:nitrite reductase [Ferrimonas sediminum]SDK10745.1 formate-dependent nitrite reductase complex subunit NrfG [Ferrimonas sediminum]
MISLAVAMSVVLLVVTSFIIGYHLRLTALLPAIGNAKAPTGVAGGPGRAPIIKGTPLIMLTFLIFSSLLLYWHLGRYSDWNRATPQVRVDYLLQAAINQSRLSAEQHPQDPQAQLRLVEDYAAGGKYAEAVNVLESLLAQSGASAGLLGLKAKYLYYRDGRQLTPEVKSLTRTALERDDTEFTARELLASHAYRQGQYDLAIEHWQRLLQGDVGLAQRRAIGNALTRAQAKILTGQP